MELKKALEHMVWADEQYLKYCSKVTNEQFETKVDVINKSMQFILAHILEVYKSWIHFLTDKKYDGLEEIYDFNREQLLSGIRGMHQRILKFVEEEDMSTKHTIQWDEGHKEVITTPDNVIFNYITHSAYHRGQLALILRVLGFTEIEETDFNPYIYYLGQQ